MRHSDSRGLWLCLIAVAALVAAVIASQIVWVLGAAPMEILAASAAVFAGAMGLGVTAYRFVRDTPST